MRIISSVLVSFWLCSVHSSVSGADFAYVGSAKGGSISVIDTSSHSHISSFPLSGGVGGMAAGSDGSFLYVTNPALNTVSIFDVVKGYVSNIIPVRSGPSSIAMTPDGSTLYVANQGDNSLSVISTAAKRVLTTIPVGARPSGLAITPDGNTVVVANLWSDTVQLIDTSVNAVRQTIPVEGGPTAVRISPDGNFTYVLAQYTGKLIVFRSPDNAVQASINVGQGPNDLALLADGRRAYVTNGTDGTVSVVDLLGLRVVENIRVGAVPTGISFSGDGKTAFVTAMRSDSLIALDIATNSVIGTVERVGIDPSVVVTVPRPAETVVASVSGRAPETLKAAENQTASVGAPREVAPDGSAGGALDGSYPNPILRNLGGTGMIPFVTSPGILGQNSALLWDNANSRIGLGVPDPDGNLTIAPNLNNARSLMFRTSQPQYGNFGFTLFGHPQPNGETQLDQNLTWGYNVDQKGPHWTWSTESYWAPAGTPLGQGQLEHYMEVGGGGPLSNARPISWLYRPYNGLIVMDLAIDNINLMSQDRSRQYGYQYPGGIILYPGAVFRGTHVGDMSGNLVQTNSAEISNLKVMTSPTGDARFYAKFIFNSTTAPRTITIPDVTGNLGVVSGTPGNNDCLKYSAGALVSTGGSCLSGPNVTGNNSVNLGANSPAINTSAPYTWVAVKAADGSTVYIPAWK